MIIVIVLVITAMVMMVMVDDVDDSDDLGDYGNGDNSDGGTHLCINYTNMKKRDRQVIMVLSFFFYLNIKEPFPNSVH